MALFSDIINQARQAILNATRNQQQNTGGLIYRDGRNPNWPSAGIVAPDYSGPTNPTRPYESNEDLLRTIALRNAAEMASRNAAEQERQRLLAERQAKIAATTARAQELAKQAILRRPLEFVDKLRAPLQVAAARDVVSSALQQERSGAIANVTAQTGRNPLFTQAQAMLPGIGVRPQQVTENIRQQTASIRNIGEAKTYFEKAYQQGITPGSEEAQNIFKETVKRYTGAGAVEVQKPEQFAEQGPALKIEPTNLQPFDYGTIASRRYEIPVTFGSRGIGDLPYYRGQTLETIYKQFYGADSIPDYSMRVWNGPAAIAIRAAEALNRKVGLDRQSAKDKGVLPSAQVEEQYISQAKLYLDLADQMQQVQDAGLNPLDIPDIKTVFPGIQRAAYLGQQQLAKTDEMINVANERMRKEQEKKESGFSA